MDAVTQYFNGDTMASDAWKSKYQMKNDQGTAVEETPADMHKRLADEFARVEHAYHENESFSNLKALSPFGRKFVQETANFSMSELSFLFFTYFDKFKHIVPQGSIMTNLGNNFVFGSLSNCFVIASPRDSYGSICRADEELVQLMKRRGGVGLSLDHLRHVNAPVTNAAKTSSGVVSFAERYSNSTREVGQDGRRGALMELLHVAHPQIFDFVSMKEDRTKVTGANVSVKFTDVFLQAVEADQDFLCRFPIDARVVIEQDLYDSLTYNKITTIGNGISVMKIRAKQLFEAFVEMAWSNAEPGAAYMSRILDYAPDAVYPRFRPVSCNPCGEIWMGDYDACRLIAQNLLGIVDNPFTEEACINYEKLYEVSYIQQRLSDNLIDLEAEYIQRIIDKVENDPEPWSEKQREIELWQKIKDTTVAGRRTGNGITALGDMLAALGLKYDSDEALQEIENVMYTKMKAELDCTIDLAILRGTFDGHDFEAEFNCKATPIAFGYEYTPVSGTNSFFQMLIDEFPEQAHRMCRYGRRNVSWSTVAPTGTVSLMTQTTSGLEPLFKAFYIRRKKINPNDKNARVDFVDQNGDQWQEYAILHPQFKEWIKKVSGDDHSEAPKDFIQNLFENSPWNGSEADNISWEKRVEIQAIIQRYTSNAISSTINLPSDVSKETVFGIYMQSWKAGLKGVTIYRDGSRSGVLITEASKTTKDEFGYTNAIKRSDALDADYYCVTSKGVKYAVVVGLIDGNPYELFAFEAPQCEENLKGKIIKKGKGIYAFESPNYNISNLQLNSEHSDERLLTRWVSLALRHGANPKYIVEQVNKSEVMVTSFTKVIARVLKNYIPDEATGEECPACGEHTVIYEEGCKKCTSCGNSKC